MKRILFLILCLTAVRVFAQSPGTSGADILKTPPGVRPAAMGGSYSAFGDDVYVIGYNPAGLSRVAKYSLGIDHVQGLADVQTQSLSFTLPSHKLGMFGGQVLYRHMPVINNELAVDAPVKAYDLLLTVVNSRQVGRFSVGASFKTLVLNLAEKKALTNAFDAGVKVPVAGGDVALAVQNVGPAVRFEPDPRGKDPLPLTVRLGLAHPVLVRESSTLLGGAEIFHVRDEGLQASAGFEYWHRSLVALRSGYRWNRDDSLAKGFSLGAGLRHGIGRLEYEVGYAWKPSRVQTDFSLNSHMFGILFWY